MTKIAHSFEALNQTDAYEQSRNCSSCGRSKLGPEMTKYTFDDNSFLAVSGVLGNKACDADSADSIKAYAAWVGNDAAEQAEVRRLLEALAQ